MARFRDIRSIGSGGFGEVTLCERTSDNAHFAKKRLIDESENAVARFTREARLLSSLDHPNVVKVVGKRLQSSPYFYLMPVYSGSLDAQIPSLVQDTDRIEAIFGRILAGVSYAHEQGVIHRDLKPQNVLLNTDTDVVVSDFGLGRQLDSASTRQTMTGMAMGTQLYMAPEQFIDSKSVDQRSDVFALGRMLLELYTGMLSPGPQDYSPVPPRVLPLVHRATHHKPESRFADATEFRNAWLQALDLTARTDGLQSLHGLTAELSATPDLPDEKIDELVDSLVACLNDPDEIEASLMKLPAFVIGRAVGRKPTEMTSVIDAYCRFINSQGWAFEYTDTIANKCDAIVGEIHVSEPKAKLIAATAEVGVDHNRWFVMEKAARMLEALQTEPDVAAAVDALARAPSRVRNGIGGYLNFTRLDGRLRQLFEETN